VALGCGLRAAGNAVCVAATSEFAEMIGSAGLEFSRLSGDLRAIAAKHQATFERRADIFSMVHTAQRIMRSMVAPWVAEGIAACRDADLVIAGGGAVPFGASLAEALSKPFVQAYLQPHMLFADLPSTRLPVPRRPLPASANRVINHTLDLLSWRAQRPAVNDVIRAQLGLPPYPWYGPSHRLSRGQWPILYGFSKQVVPPPAGLRPRARVTGYWFLDSNGDWQPPADLAAFLEAGPPPIYAGFGSMSGEGAQAMTDLILQAVALTDRRAVLATGWAGLAARRKIPADRFIIIDGAPHDWLFPRVAAAIHHGGAGTTAAALRAGIPSITVPFFGDQSFWAWRLEQLGAAPARLQRRIMTAEDLARAIVLATDETMPARARELGRRINAEHGVSTALETLSDWGLVPLGKP
jgi:sterol 3beta-glucosyltransferase